MPDDSIPVLRWHECNQLSVRKLLHAFGLQVAEIETDQAIPGSFWGDDEAGLIGHLLYLRSDTPLHSILHEACHYICMAPERRARLDTNAGGDYDEENAVCYLQIHLSAEIDGYSPQQCMSNMDAWGYSFRLGSAQAWFEHDAEDAAAWLRLRGLGAPGKLNQQPDESPLRQRA